VAGRKLREPPEYDGFGSPVYELLDNVTKTGPIDSGSSFAVKGKGDAYIIERM
jgi:hypothetical protein